MVTLTPYVHPITSGPVAYKSKGRIIAVDRIIMLASPRLSLRLSVAICGVVLLSACGSAASGSVDEKIQRAEQAALRAEAAQKSAEQAAQKAVAFSSHNSAPVADTKEPQSDADRDSQKASQDPNSAYFDPSANQDDG